MTKTKEPNPPFPVEIIDVVPTEVANPFTKQKATLQPTAIAVYDCIKGAEMLEDFDIVEKGLDWFREHYPKEYMVLLDYDKYKSNRNIIFRWNVIWSLHRRTSDGLFMGNRFHLN